jgi:hypothetical protein
LAATWRGQPLVAGDLRAGTIVELVYDGAAFQLLTPPPGGWRLLKSLAANNSPTLDFPGLDASCDLHMLVMTNLLPATDGVDLLVRLSHGGSFTAGTGYAFHTGGGAVTSTSYAAVNGSSNSAFFLNNSLIGNAAGEGYSGRFCVGGAGDARAHLAWAQGVTMNQSGVGYASSMGGYQNTSAAVDGLRVLFSSGNIASGRAALYALRK